MGVAGQAALSEQPEIMELFRVLEGNGMTKELQEVDSLVKYLESMESQFGQVLDELQEVRAQLTQMEDKGIGAATTRLVERAEDKVQEIGEQLIKVRNNLIQSAKYAVTVFQEKGMDALRNAVSAMKIPVVLSALKESFHRGMESMNRNAEKMETISSEVHAIGGHMKNIGRILLGRERKAPEKKNPDKGILAKVQKAFLACGSHFSEMEKQTENLLKKAERFLNGGEKKKSVKAEIQQIKSERSEKPILQPVPQDQVR